MKRLNILLLLFFAWLIFASSVFATVQPMPSQSGAFTDFILSSADVKPTPTTYPKKVIPGSKCFEYDTQIWYLYNADTGWTVTQTPDTP